MTPSQKLIFFVWIQETLLESIRNKFKKERRPLLSLEAVQAAKAKDSNPGSGRKRHGDLMESTVVKKHRTSVRNSISCDICNKNV